MKAKEYSVNATGPELASACAYAIAVADGVEVAVQGTRREGFEDEDAVPAKVETRNIRTKSHRITTRRSNAKQVYAEAEAGEEAEGRSLSERQGARDGNKGRMKGSVPGPVE